MNNLFSYNMIYISHGPTLVLTVLPLSCLCIVLPSLIITSMWWPIYPAVLNTNIHHPSTYIIKPLSLFTVATPRLVFISCSFSLIDVVKVLTAPTYRVCPARNFCRPRFNRV
jgi:hypothetical protein